jgi:hypothetical protein
MRPTPPHLGGRDSVYCVIEANARREQEGLLGAGERRRQGFGLAEIAYDALGAGRQLGCLG